LKAIADKKALDDAIKAEVKGALGCVQDRFTAQLRRLPSRN